MEKQRSERKSLPTSTVIGAVALVFLAIGYQTALFVHRAASLRIVSNRDRPDTVYVVERIVPSQAGDEPEQRTVTTSVRRSPHEPSAERVRRQTSRRSYESFRFDPNTVSVEDLMRLGFSLRQAESIDNYRKKGGRFRRKADFAKSFVVADSVFRRLEEYIDIPKIDINKADSAAFETLPGIGKYFASKMVSYREELGGYSYTEQLMDIKHFDKEKFDGLKDLITVGSSVSYPLWNLTEEELTRHPYIGKPAAHGIVLFRNNSPVSDWTVKNLVRNGILDNEKGEKLARCRISPPDK